MQFIEYPTIFQLRKNIIIAYTDSNYYNHSANRERKPDKIKQSGTFTSSAKKKLSKVLDIWQYTNTGRKINYSFVTLTLSSKMDEKENHYQLLQKWIEVIITRYGKINYVWKAEYQKNGNVHYHLIIDEEINWKIARKQWNKIQSKYVDQYQIKMKTKYKNGYYHDTEIKDNAGNTVSDEIQFKRYKIGIKANWRNPNSTDVKVVTEEDNVAAYIGKYISKEEEEETNPTHKKIKRYWGCSDTLKEIKYTTIEENNLSDEELIKLKNSTIKTIEENGVVKCKLIAAIQMEKLYQKESEQLKKNRDILYPEERKINQKKISKEINFYDKLFAQSEENN